MASQDHSNGLGSMNGDAESSKMAAAADPSFHALNLGRYIYNVGFLGQNWADVGLVVFDSPIKLHRIILSRSPWLHDIMLNVVPGATIRLNFSDENITADAVHIALQHLYNPSQHLVTAANARAVLATAYLLQGMPELVHHAYTVCRDSLSDQAILDYVRWLAMPPPPECNGTSGHDGSTLYGSVSVNGNGHASTAVSEPTASELWSEDGGHARYGEWSTRLKSDVMDYLIHNLPHSILDSGESLSSSSRLQAVYIRLPYELFKLCSESPDVPFSSLQDRFGFAKKAISQRKKLSPGSHVEESAVLAHVEGEEMGVLITRRSKRSRTALWKVEG